MALLGRVVASNRPGESVYRAFACAYCGQRALGVRAKLATGNYDWLGVRRNGRYVVGRPRLTPVRRDDETPPPDPVRNRHRIEFLGPLSRAARWEAYATADEAGNAYARIVTGDPITPMRNTGVWKVRLILDGDIIEELLVVRALPRLL